MEDRHRDQIAAVVDEWDEAEKKYNQLKLKDPASAEEKMKRMYKNQYLVYASAFFDTAESSFICSTDFIILTIRLNKYWKQKSILIMAELN